MDRALQISRALTRLMAIVGGVILLILAGVICFEVIARKLFAFSTRATEEYSGYGLAICLSWSIAFTLLERAHVRIDFLYRKAAKPLAIAMDLTALLAILAAIGLMAVNAFTVFLFNLEFLSRSNSTLQTPLWIPQLIWLFGFAVFICVALVLLAAVLRRILQKDQAAVQALIGPRGLDDEIKDDLTASGLAREDASRDKSALGTAR